MSNPTSNPGVTEGEATARDGTPLSYRLVKGNGTQRFALVHSLAMNKDFWNGVVSALGEHADVLIYDCRGHGASGKPSGPYTVEGFADDLADLMDAVGWSSATIAGASMGGCIALAFCAAYPARVDGLGLFDTTSWYGEKAEAAWQERAQKALDEGLDSLIGFQKSRWFSEGFLAARPDIVSDAVSVFLANDRAAYAETCRMLGRADLRSALPGFNFPCRVAVGTEDYATPPDMARYLSENIPGATLHILDGVRHFTPLEVPEIIAGHLLNISKRAA